MHRNVACQQCHTSPVFSNAGSKCADCHADIHRRQMGAQCEQCHSVNGWTVSLQSIREHQNRFPLIGAHATADCDSCHKGAAVGQFKGLSTDCTSCHLTSYLNTRSPSHTALKFPTDCQQCHTNLDSWAGAKFDHAAATGFALTGAHASLDCSACHTGGQFQGTSSNCVSCHIKDFNSASNPNHVQLGFPQTCSQCHNTSTWQGATFDHAATGFVLTGAHASLSCSSCHTGAALGPGNATCVSCHLSDFTRTTNPNHVAGGFSQQCNVCHTTTAWQPATFDHSKTVFPLTGAHVAVACASCHVGGRYTGTPTACVSCHLSAYQGTSNPNHQSVGFPTDCSLCHTTANWLGANFNHASTGFILTGAHASLSCSSCHTGGTLSNATCVTCHLNDFNRTTNPNHVTGGFPQQCSTCHTTTAWQPATFDHSKTVFPLTGAHTTVACASCHVGGRFAGTPTTCVSCHLSDYQSTNNPNHVSAGFPTDCTLCHTTAAWLGAKFDHSTTGFPLTGTHATITCAQCHVNGKYAGTPKDCASCHLATYQQTSNPNHASVGFPTDCSLCHNTTNWLGAQFNHATTGFALTGAHTTLSCSACHTAGTTLTAANTACVSCHLKNYNATTNPNHVTGGFPQQCDICHSTSAWQPATFDHSKTVFPLTGAHTTVACANCHIGGRYAGTPTDCYSCHKTEYGSTTNPNHVAAGFPTTCQTCHTTTSWAGATFNHTWFPIPHNTARLCSDCHTNPSNYTIFVCTNCHTQAQTDPHHSGVKGYVWNSANCYSCHRNGGGG